jgi:hypothetical protein
VEDRGWRKEEEEGIGEEQDRERKEEMKETNDGKEKERRNIFEIFNPCQGKSRSGSTKMNNSQNTMYFL